MQQEELSGKQAAEALLNQASDPSFFNLTEDGDDLDYFSKVSMTPVGGGQDSGIYWDSME